MHVRPTETASSYWFAAYASNVLHTGCYCKANPVTALERLSRRTCGGLRVYAQDAGSQGCSATSKAGTEDSACHDRWKLCSCRARLALRSSRNRGAKGKRTYDVLLVDPAGHPTRCSPPTTHNGRLRVKTLYGSCLNTSPICRLWKTHLEAHSWNSP